MRRPICFTCTPTSLRPLEDYAVVNVHGPKLLDIRYADDIVLTASKMQDEQKLLSCVNERFQKFEMKITEKTEIMRISKDNEFSDVCVCSVEWFVFGR